MSLCPHGFTLNWDCPECLSPCSFCGVDTPQDRLDPHGECPPCRAHSRTQAKIDDDPSVGPFTECDYKVGK
jgi:hypothetical protein